MKASNNMAKSKSQEIQELKVELERLKSWRLTEMIEPNVKAPSGSGPFQEKSFGWTFNAYSKEVYEEWSTRTSHGSIIGLNISQQRSQDMYSSKELALRAMRACVEQQMLAELYKIDQKIRSC